MYRYACTVCLLACLVVCGASCEHAKMSYRLSRFGYSPFANALLYVNYYDGDGPLKSSWLAVYDVQKGVARHLRYPINAGIRDFAWVPGQATFVVTHGDRMTLFQQDGSGDYSGTAVPCPVHVQYMFCSWDSSGEWLAVNCHSLKGTPVYRLGIYRLEDNRFVLTDIVCDHRVPIWGNGTTLYVPNGSTVAEVRVKSGVPKVVRTFPIERDAPLFLDMFDDQALIQVGNKVMLGGKTLVDLDRSTKSATISTNSIIFVSASSANLVAFDSAGQEIDRIDPGRVIRFGSVGEDENTVYGLANSIVLRVRVEGGNLRIKEIADIASLN